MPIHVANLRPNNKVLCWWTWASTIKYHRPSSWTSRNLFLIVLEAGSLTPESQYGWILVRALLLACWWLPSCWVVTQTFQAAWTQKGRQRWQPSGISSYQGTNSIMRTPSSWLHPPLINPLKAPSTNIFTLRIRALLWSELFVSLPPPPIPLWNPNP